MLAAIARGPACSILPPNRCCGRRSRLPPLSATRAGFRFPFQVYLVPAMTARSLLPPAALELSQLSLAFGTTQLLNWMQQKHLPGQGLHSPPSSPPQGGTKPSGRSGQNSPANGPGPEPGAILTPTAPVFAYMSPQPLLCPPLLCPTVFLPGAKWGWRPMPSSAEGPKSQGRGHSVCAGATLPRGAAGRPARAAHGEQCSHHCSRPLPGAFQPPASRHFAGIKYSVPFSIPSLRRSSASQ